MKTSMNKESLEDRLVERDRIDVSFAYYGFFSFTRIRDGEYKVIGTIRCQKVYKLYFQRVRIEPNPEDEEIITPEYAYDFCFEDDLPILSGEEGDGYEYVREGDILNIRTNNDLEYPPTCDQPRWECLYRKYFSLHLSDRIRSVLNNFF